MGIININILSEPDDYQVRMQQALLQEVLVQEHRRGEHTYGLMRRECPLCRAEN